MGTRIIQVALSVVFLALLVQVVLIAPSQIRDTQSKAALLPQPREVIKKNDGADQSMKGIHLIETQQGQKEWELWSEKAVSLKAKELLELDNVKTILFSDSGVTFTVTGDKGHLQVNSKDLKIEGNVITRSSNGYVFRTETVQYESKIRQLYAPSNVHVVGPFENAGPTLKLTGVGMLASLDKDEIFVQNNVKAEKLLENNRKADIRSQRAKLSAKSNTVEFEGNVVLDMDSMRITGPHARFDYDEKKKMVRTANFTGGARVSDIEKWGTAQNLEVDFLADKYTFRGDPRVVQNNDELRGDEIVFLDGGKQVQVKKARAKVDNKHLEQGQKGTQ